jgi:hypothetical protein|tara:strand:+ start:2023 stop:2187 length:165 start_codon:yes stop_codon:yes gene_type:complete
MPGEWAEVEQGVDELICEIMLEHAPGSLVRIVEGENPHKPDREYLVLVPEWGIA